MSQQLFAASSYTTTEYNVSKIKSNGSATGIIPLTTTIDGKKAILNYLTLKVWWFHPSINWVGAWMEIYAGPVDTGILIAEYGKGKAAVVSPLNFIGMAKDFGDYDYISVRVTGTWVEDDSAYGGTAQVTSACYLVLEE